MSNKFYEPFKSKKLVLFFSNLLKTKRKTLNFAILLLCMFLLVMGILKTTYIFPASNQNHIKPVIVLDAGHGGEDPGKIGVNGEFEKDINLSIVLILKELLEEDYTVILTRQTDTMLCNEGVNNKKNSDLKNRVRIINESSCDIAILIHQNSFQTQSAKGAQVFYYTSSEDGKLLANYVQEELVTNCDPSNTRTIKSDKSYYVLKNATPTTIIVECGFLSNPDEASKLGLLSYQENLAVSIKKGIDRYFEKKEED